MLFQFQFTIFKGPNKCTQLIVRINAATVDFDISYLCLAKKQFSNLVTLEFSYSSNPKSLLKFDTSIFCFKLTNPRYYIIPKTLHNLTVARDINSWFRS